MKVCYDSPVIIGGGALGGAVAIGLAKSGLSPVVSHPKESRLAELEALGLRLTRDNVQALEASAGPVLFAVKPWLVKDVVRALADRLAGRVCCSMAARVSLEELKSCAPGAKWGRAIPNIAAAVGAGFAGVASDDWDEDERNAMLGLFRREGEAVWVGEKDLNAVSTLSGSAIAFVLMAAEAFIQGGLGVGMSCDGSLKAALATFEGAAKLVRETGLHPAALKDSVCTPRGTTIAGLRALEAKGFKSALIEGLIATYNAG